METKYLTKWEFEKELKKMAVSCIGVKEDTAKKKASNIFKKYDEILAYSKSDKEYYENEYRKIKNMFDTLKSGVIKYTRDKDVGKFLLKDIEQVEIREKYVLLITKTGREITLGHDFNYLKELF
jgi:DNA-binding LytR/AlgR family response regulator